MSIDTVYRDARQRIAGLVAELPPEGDETPVPACPGWRVRDVVAHLAGIAEDTLEGRVTAIPTEQQTAAEVARHQDETIGELLELWLRLPLEFDRWPGGNGPWIGAVDILTHEQDIRGAVGRPGSRDLPAIAEITNRLLRIELPVPITIEVEDAVVRTGAPATAEPALTLRTTWWEAFRWRMGRRSATQLAGMDWTGDPTAILHQLPLFGPAVAALVE